MSWRSCWSGRVGSVFLLKMVRKVWSPRSVLIFVYKLSMSMVKRREWEGTTMGRVGLDEMVSVLDITGVLGGEGA